MGAELLLVRPGGSSGKVSAAASSTLASSLVGSGRRRLGAMRPGVQRRHGCGWQWQHRKDGDLSKKFWSTKDPGQQPFSFNIGLGSVIKGWDEGVMTMQLGEVARIQCTPDYAYGAGGFPAWGIQPNSVLVFEIEVLSAQ